MSSIGSIGTSLFGSVESQNAAIKPGMFGGRKHKKMGLKSRRHSRSRRHKIVPALVAGSRKRKSLRRRKTRKMV
jgi:hypothetical protein